MFDFIDKLFFEQLLVISSFGIATNILILKTKKIHIEYTSDYKNGPQKIHEHITPRIGGVSIFLVLLLNIFWTGDYNIWIFTLLMSSIPCFFLGFLDDLYNCIKPRYRLLGTIFSGFVAVFILKIDLNSFGISFIDNFVFAYGFGSLITILCILVLTQAFNIIDGLNGLSVICAISILFVITYIAKDQGDLFLVKSSLILISVLSTFLFFNFPKGKMFLGDGGAYLIGYMVSLFLIMLSMRNEIVSPFACFMLALYPSYEILRSFFRRLISKNVVSMSPDLKHLHSLYYQLISKRCSLNKFNKNSISSLFSLISHFFICIWTTIYYTNLDYLLLGILIHIFLYEFQYFLIYKKLQSN